MNSPSRLVKREVAVEGLWGPRTTTTNVEITMKFAGSVHSERQAKKKKKKLERRHLSKRQAPPRPANSMSSQCR